MAVVEDVVETHWLFDDDSLDSVDLEIEVEMPETPVTHRGKGRQLHHRPGHHANVTKSGSNRSVDGPDLRNRKLGRTPLYNVDNEDDHDKEDNFKVEGKDQDPQEKLCLSLKTQLTECSSQRLRCLHMTLRRLANVDNRISEKDMLLAFQENQIPLTSRLTLMMTDMFSGQQGIDYERLYKCLVAAHDMTGRDSVKARRKKNELTSRSQMSQEKRDADFLSRIESQLIRDQTFFDMDMLRATFQEADSQRSGKIPMERMVLICSEKTPLYGALLENLLKRCDEDKNGTVSWPTLLSFLERGQNTAREKDPELHLLPEKARATAAVNVAPDPIMELSSGARTRLMNKLMRKASSRSGVARAGSSLSNATSVTSTNSSRDPSPDPAPKTEAAIPEDETKQPEKVVSFQAGTVKTDSGTEEKEQTQQSDKASREGEKKKEPATPGKAKGKLSTKDVPLIEVDKASESGDHGTNTSENSKGTSSTTAAPSAAADSAVSSEKKATTSKTSSSATTTTTASTTTAASTTLATTTTTTTTVSTSSSSNNANTANATSNNASNKTSNSASNKAADASRKSSTMKNSSGVQPPPGKGGVRVMVPKDYHPPDIPVDPPNERLQLEWVYGCRGNDCRRNVQVLRSGEIIYFISNVCVVLNHRAHAQRHYKEHSEDVKCLAVHSNGVLVASGQFSSKLRPEHVAHVRVWRSDLLQTLHVLGTGIFTKAVMCLAFVPNKDILVAVDNSQDKYLTVWDLDTQSIIAANYIFLTDTVCDMEFNPKYPDLLVTSGKEHLQWWKVYPESGELHPFTVPDYETYLKAKFVVCVVHTEKGDLITGDSNGTVYIWGDGSNKITNFIKHGHDGPVLSVLYYKGYLLTGGRDGTISAWVWGKNMDKAATVPLPSSEGGVRTLLATDGTLVISTTMNSLLSITMATGTCPLDSVTLDPLPITQGHFDELRAVTVIQNSFIQADVLTAGSDGVLCKFASNLRAPVWKLFMKGMQYLCVDCSNKGDIIVLGTKDGRVVQLQINRETMQVIEVMNNKVSTGRMLCIALSPDDSWIAVGAEDTAIYLFRMGEPDESGLVSWNLWGILKGHSGHVVSLDWTLQPYADGVFLLRSSSSTPEQKFWNVLTCSEVDGGQLMTLTWASNTCTLDHQIPGVWRSKQAEQGQVNALDVHPAGTLVAMGNSAGLLSLYRYPCIKDMVFSHTYPAHQTVQAVRFTPSGQRLVTVGGNDTALLQWKLI